MDNACHSRRTFMKKGLAFAGSAWLTQVAHQLARASESDRADSRPQSIICLWLTGGPSQLETFDPHPGKRIAYGSRAIKTALPGVQIGAGLERVAEQMGSISLIRSMVSREADHVRGSYLMKTGYSPDLAVMHPSMGAIVAHELPELPVDIPRHISILGSFFPRSDQPARGGFLGSAYDAFKVWDPAAPVPNVHARVSPERQQRRVADVDVIDRVFRKGREEVFDSLRNNAMLHQADQMMSSAQLRAFNTEEEPLATRLAYGETPFGRGCLAARRLIEVGVRAVEVSLNDWDSHRNNHETHRQLIAELDPALAALIADLRDRDLLERTIVLCAGEFGRTPTFNHKEGRDHWNQGFSIALAGGGIREGLILGQTDPEGGPVIDNKYSFPDVYATILTALGIDVTKDNVAPNGQLVRLTLGRVIEPLLS
jgi:hypothetical protein